MTSSLLARSLTGGSYQAPITGVRLLACSLIEDEMSIQLEVKL